MNLIEIKNSKKAFWLKVEDLITLHKKAITGTERVRIERNGKCIVEEALMNDVISISEYKDHSLKISRIDLIGNKFHEVESKIVKTFGATFRNSLQDFIAESKAEFIFNERKDKLHLVQFYHDEIEFSAVGMILQSGLLRYRGPIYWSIQSQGSDILKRIFFSENNQTIHIFGENKWINEEDEKITSVTIPGHVMIVEVQRENKSVIKLAFLNKNNWDETPHGSEFESYEVNNDIPAVKLQKYKGNEDSIIYVGFERFNR